MRQTVIAGRDAGEPGMWLQAERLLQEAALASGRPDSDPTGEPPVVIAEPPAREARRAYRDPEEVSEEELLAALRANRWRIQRAAAQLGISRGALDGDPCGS